jgi:hypothetical protein
MMMMMMIERSYRNMGLVKYIFEHENRNPKEKLIWKYFRNGRKQTAKHTIKRKIKQKKTEKWEDPRHNGKMTSTEDTTGQRA